MILNNLFTVSLFSSLTHILFFCTFGMNFLWKLLILSKIIQHLTMQYLLKLHFILFFEALYNIRLHLRDHRHFSNEPQRTIHFNDHLTYEQKKTAAISFDRQRQSRLQQDLSELYARKPD